MEETKRDSEDGGAADTGLQIDVDAADDTVQAMFTLYDAIEEMLTTDAKQTTADVVLDAAVDVPGLAQTGIHFHDADERSLVPVSWSGNLEREFGEPPALGPDTEAWSTFENGEIVSVEDYWSDEGINGLDSTFRSELIVSFGEYGVLLSGSPEPREFEDTDRSFLEVLCANAADAMNRIERENALHEREQRIDRQQSSLTDLVETVQDGVESLSDTATDVSRSSEQISDLADDQAATMTDRGGVGHERRRRGGRSLQ
ncbi:GAF domain-containing protein [Halorientalis regularis]|uniref:GAF domain-containing protein n=1 Tax=Halorientalis regularis TaxID=660518 RepID=A0A1G7T5N6_9EURY|nr:GAF domain-containing protein [Halorientalis regularis]SDG30548.1 GAF domain-containing protein [Halorientalis regularis]